ncbi:hypothetical protein GUJ93_ZPchr0016g2624 [Zizania palustris]|uniref:Uncharacterized protein n=1 Tax=Zizania palustris TaxID=103762 RepID=A0A8J5TI95_ZIZPA|nr:hypothetical protein GUJ93_ZPchr0016g2624 [Zizania palustris]
MVGVCLSGGAGFRAPRSIEGRCLAPQPLRAQHHGTVCSMPLHATSCRETSRFTETNGPMPNSSIALPRLWHPHGRLP